MKTFENIASLKLATLKEGQFVETGGYYSKGDGGGARYLIATPQAADEYGDHTLANGNVAVLQSVPTPLNYGAISGSTTQDALLNLEACLKSAVSHGTNCDWSGDFRIESPLRLDVNYSGLTTKGKIKLRLVGEFTSNVAALHIPTAGDTYGGTSNGAVGMVLSAIEGDCSGATSTSFTTGCAVLGGSANKIKLLEGHDANKSGVLVGSIVGTAVSVEIDSVIAYDNGNSSQGQGFASGLDNEDDAVRIGSIDARRNTVYGWDFSTGPISIGYIYTEGNGTSGNGGAGKLSGVGTNRTTIDHCVSVTDRAGMTTTGDQAFFSCGVYEVYDSEDQGGTIGHNGIYRFGTYIANNSGTNGLRILFGDVNVGNLKGENNGANLVTAGGDASITITLVESKNHASGAAVLHSGEGYLNVERVVSDGDINGAVRLVGASEHYVIGDVEYTYPTSKPAVFLNANPKNTSIRSITPLDASVEISDAAAGTVYGQTTLVATTTELDDITASINTNGKWKGKQVFNTTLNRPVWAINPGASNLWVFADGTTAHTPA